jgi:cysteine desulfurase/selenocysteine lyase
MSIKNQFPIFASSPKPFFYLDTAATALKPNRVIEKITDYYSKYSANVHRGLYEISEKATIEYEETRNIVQNFIHAKSSDEIIYTKGTTEAINLIARTLGESFSENDCIVITELEHHSNIVPWQLLKERKNITLKICPIDDQGDLILSELENIFKNNNVKLFSFVAISNSIGTVNPVKEMIALAHQYGALTLVDCAQLAAHQRINVQDWDADFICFSGHKIYGPTGVGILYGKKNLLEAMPPFLGGGDMIDLVTFEKTTYNKLPYKFEAGTPAIASVIALKESLLFQNELFAMPSFETSEKELLHYLEESLRSIKEVCIIGNPKHRSGAVSFSLEQIHSQDLATMLGLDGIAVRSGHHCTQPLLKRLGFNTTTRASLGIYNTQNDIDQLTNSIKKIISLY